MKANAQTAMRSMLKADARVSQNLFSELTSRQVLRISEPKVTSLTALVRQVRRSHRWENALWLTLASSSLALLLMSFLL